MEHLSRLSFVVGALQNMSRAEAIALAKLAGVPESTVRKIRGGYIKEPGAGKVDQLYAAIARAEKPPAPSAGARTQPQRRSGDRPTNHRER